MRAAALAIALGLAGGACVRQLPAPANRHEPSSLKVEVVCAGKTADDCATIQPSCLTAPADSEVLGTPTDPVPADQRFYLARVTALGSSGQVDTSYHGTANAYVMFDGNTTPRRNANTPPLATVSFAGGKGCLSITIPPAFNKAALWVEDAGTSFALGASDPIWRPAPLISDVQANPDPTTFASPLDEKHIEIAGGTDGKPIVVTGVFAQEFMVTDTGVPDGKWASLDIYSYSQPTVKVGDTVTDLNGTLSEFHGLSELNFPIWTPVLDPATGNPIQAPVPPPHLLQPADLADPLNAMDPWESGLVEVDGWKICNFLSTSTANKYDLQGWTKYQQWKLAPASAVAQDGTCNDSNASMSVQTNTTVASFHPDQNIGKTVCRLKGILTVVIPSPSIYLWILTPRGADDLDQTQVVADPAGCR